jgi:hypothetical protein
MPGYVGVPLRSSWAVLVAAATTLVTSALYYIVLGQCMAEAARHRPQHGRGNTTGLADGRPGRSHLVVAFVLAYLLSRLGQPPPRRRCGWDSSCDSASRLWPWSARCCTRTTRWGCT